MAFAPRLCIMRHRAAVVKIQRGLSESEKCATCPAIIEYLEESKMTENEDSKTTKCVVCGREGLKIAARGMCKKCYYQAIQSGDKVRNRTRPAVDNPNVKAARPETKTPETETQPSNSATNLTQNPSNPYPFSGAVFANPEYIAALERENKNLRLINTTLFDLVDQLRKGAAA